LALLCISRFARRTELSAYRYRVLAFRIVPRWLRPRLTAGLSPLRGGSVANACSLMGSPECPIFRAPRLKIPTLPGNRCTIWLTLDRYSG
jgi:hypothetical protein